jgi:hypothetical protein
MGDMNVNSLSSLVQPYTQSILGTSASATATAGNSSIDPSSLALPQESNPQISPFAQRLSTLQQLQQSNPAQYQQVTSQIATNLQSAAKTAAANGNTSQASQLNQLATDFSNASQNNTLPNIQDLAQAAGGLHGRHHHGHGGGHGGFFESSNTSDSSTTSSATSSTSSTNSGSGSGSTGSGAYNDPLSQLISAFLANNATTTQNTSLNPMTIINNTLSGATLS